MNHLLLNTALMPNQEAVYTFENTVMAIGIAARAHTKVSHLYKLRYRETIMLCAVASMGEGPNKDGWNYRTYITERAGFMLTSYRPLAHKLLNNLTRKGMLAHRAIGTDTHQYQITGLGFMALKAFHESMVDILQGQPKVTLKKSK